MQQYLLMHIKSPMRTSEKCSVHFPDLVDSRKVSSMDAKWQLTTCNMRSISVFRLSGVFFTASMFSLNNPLLCIALELILLHVKNTPCFNYHSFVVHTQCRL